ncbi:MAG: RDD family protein [Pseudomonadota bacterium]
MVDQTGATTRHNPWIDLPNAPFWRRLAALLYDSLIVAALLMIATALLLPLNDGEAFDAGNRWFQLYLVLVVGGFFLLFWRKGGQTLGMRAWKIKLVSHNGTPPGYAQLLVRGITAALGLLPFGLGWLWSLVDRERLAVHDRLSRSRIVLVRHQ